MNRPIITRNILNGEKGMSKVILDKERIRN